MAQATDNEDLDQGNSGGGGEKYLHFQYVIKMEQKEFASGLDEGCERKIGVKNDSKIWLKTMGE